MKDSQSKKLRRDRAAREFEEMLDRLDVSTTRRSLPRLHIVKWGGGRIDAFRPIGGVRFDYCPFLWDHLDWGPQHLDLEVQHQMRQCYFRWPATWLTEVESYCRALETGDPVHFWCEPTLGSCLSILWLLATLAARNAALHSTYLVLSPGRSNIEQLDPKAMVKAITERIPTQEVLQPLMALRGHIASDSDEVRADLSAIPSPVREWASVTDRMEDFLPDGRGLDLLDSLILDALANEEEREGDWMSAISVVGTIDPHLEVHHLPMHRVCERLLELSDSIPPLATNLYGLKDRLVETWFDGEPVWSSTRFRLTQLGRRARAGELDALPHCRFDRWVGGRRVSIDRPLRRATTGHPPPYVPAPAQPKASTRRKRATGND